MTTETPDPATLWTDGPFAPAASRRLDLAGTEVELLWLPERRGRGGVPTDDRPPFRADVASRIVREEAVWNGPACALTPNRFPFARRQLVLWSTRALREPDAEMLELAFSIAERGRGTVLVNSVGAAASIARAHLHIVGETVPFLDAIATEAHDLDGIDLGVDGFRASPPYPAVLIGFRGTPRVRATASRRLLDLRTTPAFNLVASGDTTWLFPRSAVEIPAPSFPHALGAAEIWGRWCFADETAFATTTADDLARALALGGFANP